ncbi:uncharacterized protein EDB91DRAFT_1083455 [Suillus paluster]|uniref:uncharacterized protein n=1 Tax=Suillus paluster TaxID=48578 RepID=UPI001B86826A|nr:uncharacterized protein EDB91DRAFT_1083455 [Suillus paluster]KAG1736109.1 hypothetical protein EDB91DRAFT_1083455 [Suillus paluster]
MIKVLEKSTGFEAPLARTWLCDETTVVEHHPRLFRLKVSLSAQCFYSFVEPEKQNGPFLFVAIGALQCALYRSAPLFPLHYKYWLVKPTRDTIIDTDYYEGEKYVTSEGTSFAMVFFSSQHETSDNEEESAYEYDEFPPSRVTTENEVHKVHGVMSGELFFFLDKSNLRAARASQSTLSISGFTTISPSSRSGPGTVEEVATVIAQAKEALPLSSKESLNLLLSPLGVDNRCEAAKK